MAKELTMGHKRAKDTNGNAKGAIKDTAGKQSREPKI